MDQGQTTFKRELLAVLPSLRAFAISLTGRHDQADNKPRRQFARATVDTGESDGAHGADSSQVMTINAWSSMISTG